MNTPVLFIVFNRPEFTLNVFESIRKAAPKKLYVSADGPRTNVAEDLENCKKARTIATKIDWDCELHILFHNYNLGCKTAVSTALNWIFEKEESAIILEDDCVPDPSFFPFCSQMLNEYKNDKRIISINGFNFGYQGNPNSYFFSSLMCMWGWATWKRSAASIDYNMTKWEKTRFKKLNTLFLLKSDNYNWIEYWWREFNKISNNEIDTWDYQWIYYQLSNRLLSIVPNRNLIENIGFNMNATHTKNEASIIAQTQSNSLSFPLMHPLAVVKDKIYEREYLMKLWVYLPNYNLGYFLRSIFK